MPGGNRDTEFGILGALVLALILGLLCKFCIICPCSNCGEGMSYDDQSKLCCDKDKQLCCPSGSRQCSQLQGCSELQLGCQSGCCTDKCECLMPPPGNNVTWTACKAGYSDCNSDGTWDCNTTNSSKACFGGACDIASDSSPPPLGTCAEGWSDCDNNESTGTAMEGGSGCECNTGSGLFTCCGGKCISTPTCQNPVMGCNSTNPCCSGWGCIIPPGDAVGECKPCDDFSGSNCSSCPSGCGFNATSSKCDSCNNPFRCSATDKCCCGYECNTSTSKCSATYQCKNPATGDCPAKPCCNGYGCLNGKCEPCSNFSGTGCSSCPTGCGFNVTSKNCTSCNNPISCSGTNSCCCGFFCNPSTNQCGINPPCKGAFLTCSNSDECCSNNCKSVIVTGNPTNLCCYECLDGISECCDENGNPLDTNCPKLCSDGGCKVECGSDGKCPTGSKCCSGSNECSVCASNGLVWLCGGIGPKKCNPGYGNADCSGSTCSGGTCDGDEEEPEGCTNNDQCSICSISNSQCGGRGLECSINLDCSSSSCAGGACCPAGSDWNTSNGCCWDSARNCCLNSMGSCVGTCSPGTTQSCQTTDGCAGTKTCSQAGTFGECVRQDAQCGTIDCGFTGTLGPCILVLDQFCTRNCVSGGTKCTDPRLGAGTCSKTGTLCSSSTECCCDLNCQLVGGISVCCAGGIWECTPN